jgi:mono/diheme cytochrome c family protein
MTGSLFSRAVLAGAAALVVAVTVGHPDRAPAADAASSVIARGEYLVGDAGQCRDCHGGNLEGGPAPKGPPGVPWATNAPSLIGLPMFEKDSDAITFLSTTNLPNGNHPLPPMPRYRFKVDDATAIVAYLRSLK